MFLVLQIALQFPYRFWDSKVQGADYFGHVPPCPEKRGLFSVFYDMRPKVRPLTQPDDVVRFNSVFFIEHVFNIRPQEHTKLLISKEERHILVCGLLVL